jgi:hypothetical protein
MPYRDNYPSTVSEILDDRMTFRPEALRAVRAFRRSNPWRGTIAERFAKFRTLNEALADAYRMATPKLAARHITGSCSASSCYRPGKHAITLSGRLSVVTYLHEFAHARGCDERRAVRWSVNLFRRVFPGSYARCRHSGHMLISDRSR